ncbi:hypothetical protein NQ315_006416 [Exocentrus adspersus]|uniref:Uncharacterized protein n=1 Tax=Exocentrus adspersus TaxID=1586481 RepID=A0AAV8W0X2_9CUCU|nr:hypothetical protein NQ315_006416 [Exocentrus adspersus]
MKLSTNQRNLAKVAGVLGLLQGLAWAAMSLAAIILHNWSPALTADSDVAYTRLLELLIYYRFIYDQTTSSGFVVRPFDFTIFMWVYFIASIGWIALSIDQLTAIHHGKTRQKLMIYVWGVVTLITSLIDLVFACLLARDYANCTEESSESIHQCYLTTGIVMTVAARGFTLWLVNIILSFTMLYIASHIEEADKLEKWLTKHKLPRVTVPKPTNPTTRNGKESPYFLDSDSPFSFSNQDYNMFDNKGDTVSSSQGRDGRSPSGGNAPSFLSRGDRFSY